MIQDNLLFNLSDVNSVKETSVNIQDFEQYAREAQMLYLEGLIGKDLYTDLTNGVSGNGGGHAEVRFSDLLDGKRYMYKGRSEIFRGVKPYLCYLWLHLYANMGAANITPTGMSAFRDENEYENDRFKAIQTSKQHYIGMANTLEGGIIDFLQNNIDIYPEFKHSEKLEQAKNDDFEMEVFTNTYDYPENLF